MKPGQTRRMVVYMFSFVVARGALFGAPLLLANLLAAGDYGQLETAQAAASLMASAGTLGTASAIPLVLLGHTRATTLASIVAHHLGVVSVCALVAFAAWPIGAKALWPLAALLTAGITLQSLASTHLKTQGRSEASVLLDAGLFGLMASAALGAHWIGAARTADWAWAAAFTYTLALTMAYTVVLRRARSAGQALQWQSALRLGVPLMLGGVVSLLATTSGRLGMGLLADPIETADYAVLARAAALPIVAHQLILVARFRNLFTLPHAAVEAAANQIIELVAASVLGFWLLSPWLGFLLGPAFVAAWFKYQLPGLWIVAQAVLWSAIALNDLVISRHQTMARILPLTAGFMAVALSFGWWLLGHIGTTLQNFVYVHGVVMLLFYVVQSAAMLATGTRMWRTWSLAGGAYVLTISAATVMA